MCAEYETYMFIFIDGHKVYRTGGANQSSVTKAKEFGILVITVGVSKNSHLSVVGCYRPPPASEEAFKSISGILHDLNDHLIDNLISVGLPG